MNDAIAVELGMVGVGMAVEDKGSGRNASAGLHPVSCEARRLA